ncbi:MAG TPA: hypothetical protein VEY71_06240, partial [Chitinophagales bacterium]|nr:hypothetical protein [Chitinophagales bacterium]
MTHKGYLNAVLDHIEKVSVFTRDNFDKSANDAENPLLTITLQTNRNYYFSFKMQGAKADVSYVPTAHANVQPGGGIVT